MSEQRAEKLARRAAGAAHAAKAAYTSKACHGMPSRHETSPRSPAPWLPTTQYSRDFLEDPHRQRAGNEVIEGPGGLWSRCGNCGDIVPFPGAQNSCCMHHPLRVDQSPPRTPSSDADHAQEEITGQEDDPAPSPVRPRNLGRDLAAVAERPARPYTSHHDREEDRRGGEPHYPRRRSAARGSSSRSGEDRDGGDDRRAETTRDISPTLPVSPQGRSSSGVAPDSARALAQESQISPELPFLPRHVGSHLSAVREHDEVEGANAREHARDMSSEISPTLPFNIDGEVPVTPAPRSRSSRARRSESQGSSPSSTRRPHSRRRRLAAVAARLAEPFA